MLPEQATSRRWSRRSASTARTACASRWQTRGTRWTTPTSSTRPPTAPSCASPRRCVCHAALLNIFACHLGLQHPHISAAPLVSAEAICLVQPISVRPRATCRDCLHICKTRDHQRCAIATKHLRQNMALHHQGMPANRQAGPGADQALRYGQKGHGHAASGSGH